MPYPSPAGTRSPTAKAAEDVPSSLSLPDAAKYADYYGRIPGSLVTGAQTNRPTPASPTMKHPDPRTSWNQGLRHFGQGGWVVGLEVAEEFKKLTLAEPSRADSVRECERVKKSALPLRERRLRRKKVSRSLERLKSDPLRSAEEAKATKEVFVETEEKKPIVTTRGDMDSKQGNDGRVDPAKVPDMHSSMSYYGLPAPGIDPNLSYYPTEFREAYQQCGQRPGGDYPRPDEYPQFWLARRIESAQAQARVARRDVQNTIPPSTDSNFMSRQTCVEKRAEKQTLSESLYATRSLHMRGYTAEDAKEAALTGAATLRAKNDRLVEMVGDPKRLVLESSNKSLTAENEELREKIQRLSKKSYELGTRASEKTIEAPEYTGSGAYSEYMCKYKAQAEDKKKQLEKDFEELKLNRDQAFRCLEQWNTQNEKQALRMKHLAKEHEELGASHQDAIVKMKTLSKSRNTHLNSIAELKKKVEDQVKELAAARATSAEMFQGRMSLGKQVSKLESGVKVLGKEEDAACSISERLFREAREIGCLTMTENGPGIIQNVGLQEELDLRNDIQVFIKQSCTTPYARHEENRRIAEQNDRIKTPKAASGRKVSRLARLCQVHKDEQQKPTTKNADPKAQLEAGGKFWFENYRHMEEVRDGLQKKFEDQQNEYEGCNSNRTRRIGGLRSEPADAKSKIAALKMGNASLRAECKRLWDAVEDANVECKRWHDKFEDANVEREWLEEKVREHDPEFWSLLERKWDELDEKYEWVEEAWLTEDELDEDEPGEEDESDEEAGQKEEADLEKRDREADFEEWVNLIDWEGGERSDMAEYQMEEDDERDGEIALESQGDWL